MVNERCPAAAARAPEIRRQTTPKTPMLWQIRKPLITSKAEMPFAPFLR
jgi:hypothetical protein